MPSRRISANEMLAPFQEIAVNPYSAFNSDNVNMLTRIVTGKKDQDFVISGLDAYGINLLQESAIQPPLVDNKSTYTDINEFNSIWVNSVNFELTNSGYIKTKVSDGTPANGAVSIRATMQHVMDIKTVHPEWLGKYAKIEVTLGGARPRRMSVGIGALTKTYDSPESTVVDGDTMHDTTHTTYLEIVELDNIFRPLNITIDVAQLDAYYNGVTEIRNINVTILANTGKPIEALRDPTIPDNNIPERYLHPHKKLYLTPGVCVKDETMINFTGTNLTTTDGHLIELEYGNNDSWIGGQAFTKDDFKTTDISYFYDVHGGPPIEVKFNPAGRLRTAPIDDGTPDPYHEGYFLDPKKILGNTQYPNNPPHIKWAYLCVYYSYFKHVNPNHAYIGLAKEEEVEDPRYGEDYLILGKLRFIDRETVDAIIYYPKRPDWGFIDATKVTYNYLNRLKHWTHRPINVSEALDLLAYEIYHMKGCLYFQTHDLFMRWRNDTLLPRGTGHGPRDYLRKINGQDPECSYDLLAYVCETNTFWKSSLKKTYQVNEIRVIDGGQNYHVGDIVHISTPRQNEEFWQWQEASAKVSAVDEETGAIKAIAIDKDENDNYKSGKYQDDLDTTVTIDETSTGSGFSGIAVMNAVKDKYENIIVWEELTLKTFELNWFYMNEGNWPVTYTQSGSHITIDAPYYWQWKNNGTSEPTSFEGVKEAWPHSYYFVESFQEVGFRKVNPFNPKGTGTVPAPETYDIVRDKFLRADGTWQLPNQKVIVLDNYDEFQLWFENENSYYNWWRAIQGGEPWAKYEQYTNFIGIKKPGRLTEADAGALIFIINDNQWWKCPTSGDHIEHDFGTIWGQWGVRGVKGVPNTISKINDIFSVNYGIDTNGLKVLYNPDIMQSETIKLSPSNWESSPINYPKSSDNVSSYFKNTNVKSPDGNSISINPTNPTGKNEVPGPTIDDIKRNNRFLRADGTWQKPQSNIIVLDNYKEFYLWFNKTIYTWNEYINDSVISNTTRNGKIQKAGRYPKDDWNSLIYIKSDNQWWQCPQNPLELSKLASNLDGWGKWKPYYFEKDDRNTIYVEHKDALVRGYSFDTIDYDKNNLVKIDNINVKSEEYTISSENRTITFNQAPKTNDKITLYKTVKEIASQTSAVPTNGTTYEFPLPAGINISDANIIKINGTTIENGGKWFATSSSKIPFRFNNPFSLSYKSDTKAIIKFSYPVIDDTYTFNAYMDCADCGFGNNQQYEFTPVNDKTINIDDIVVTNGTEEKIPSVTDAHTVYYPLDNNGYQVYRAYTEVIFLNHTAGQTVFNIPNVSYNRPAVLVNGTMANSYEFRFDDSTSKWQILFYDTSNRDYYENVTLNIEYNEGSQTIKAHCIATTIKTNYIVVLGENSRILQFIGDTDETIRKSISVEDCIPLVKSITVGTGKRTNRYTLNIENNTITFETAPSATDVVSFLPTLLWERLSNANNYITYDTDGDAVRPTSLNNNNIFTIGKSCKTSYIIDDDRMNPEGSGSSGPNKLYFVSKLSGGYKVFTCRKDNYTSFQMHGSEITKDLNCSASIFNESNFNVIYIRQHGNTTIAKPITRYILVQSESNDQVYDKIIFVTPPEANDIITICPEIEYIPKLGNSIDHTFNLPEDNLNPQLVEINDSELHNPYTLFNDRIIFDTPPPIGCEINIYPYSYSDSPTINPTYVLNSKKCWTVAIGDGYTREFPTVYNANHALDIVEFKSTITRTDYHFNEDNTQIIFDNPVPADCKVTIYPAFQILNGIVNPAFYSMPSSLRLDFSKENVIKINGNVINKNKYHFTAGAMNFSSAVPEGCKIDIYQNKVHAGEGDGYETEFKVNFVESGNAPFKTYYVKVGSNIVENGYRIYPAKIVFEEAPEDGKSIDIYFDKVSVVKSAGSDAKIFNLTSAPAIDRDYCVMLNDTDCTRSYYFSNIRLVFDQVALTEKYINSVFEFCQDAITTTAQSRSDTIFNINDLEISFDPATAVVNVENKQYVTEYVLSKVSNTLNFIKSLPYGAVAKICPEIDPPSEEVLKSDVPESIKPINNIFELKWQTWPTESNIDPNWIWKSSSSTQNHLFIIDNSTKYINFLKYRYASISVSQLLNTPLEGSSPEGWDGVRVIFHKGENNSWDKASNNGTDVTYSADLHRWIKTGDTSSDASNLVIPFAEISSDAKFIIPAGRKILFIPSIPTNTYHGFEYAKLRWPFEYYYVTSPDGNELRINPYNPSGNDQVPGPNVYEVKTNKFLRSDATWQKPKGNIVILENYEEFYRWFESNGGTYIWHENQIQKQGLIKTEDFDILIHVVADNQWYRGPQDPREINKDATDAQLISAWGSWGSNTGSSSTRDDVPNEIKPINNIFELNWEKDGGWPSQKPEEWEWVSGSYDEPEDMDYETAKKFWPDSYYVVRDITNTNPVIVNPFNPLGKNEVPGPVIDDIKKNKFLRADATWQTVRSGAIIFDDYTEFQTWYNATNQSYEWKPGSNFYKVGRIPETDYDALIYVVSDSQWWRCPGNKNENTTTEKEQAWDDEWVGNSERYLVPSCIKPINNEFEVNWKKDGGWPVTTNDVENRGWEFASAIARVDLSDESTLKKGNVKIINSGSGYIEYKDNGDNTNDPTQYPIIISDPNRTFADGQIQSTASGYATMSYENSSNITKKVTGITVTGLTSANGYTNTAKINIASKYLARAIYKDNSLILIDSGNGYIAKPTSISEEDNSDQTWSCECILTDRQVSSIKLLSDLDELDSDKIYVVNSNDDFRPAKFNIDLNSGSVTIDDSGSGYPSNNVKLDRIINNTDFDVKFNKSVSPADIIWQDNETGEQVNEIHAYIDNQDIVCQKTAGPKKYFFAGNSKTLNFLNSNNSMISGIKFTLKSGANTNNISAGDSITVTHQSTNVASAKVHAITYNGITGMESITTNNPGRHPDKTSVSIIMDSGYATGSGAEISKISTDLYGRINGLHITSAGSSYTVGHTKIKISSSNNDSAKVQYNYDSDSGTGEFIVRDGGEYYPDTPNSGDTIAAKVNIKINGTYKNISVLCTTKNGAIKTVTLNQTVTISNIDNDERVKVVYTAPSDITVQAKVETFVSVQNLSIDSDFGVHSVTDLTTDPDTYYTVTITHNSTNYNNILKVDSVDTIVTGFGPFDNDSNIRITGISNNTSDVISYTPAVLLSTKSYYSRTYIQTLELLDQSVSSTINSGPYNYIWLNNKLYNQNVGGQISSSTNIISINLENSYNISALKKIRYSVPIIFYNKKSTTTDGVTTVTYTRINDLNAFLISHCDYTLNRLYYKNTEVKTIKSIDVDSPFGNSAVLRIDPSISSSIFSSSKKFRYEENSQPMSLPNGVDIISRIVKQVNVDSPGNHYGNTQLDINVQEAVTGYRLMGYVTKFTSSGKIKQITVVNSNSFPSNPGSAVTDALILYNSEGKEESFDLVNHGGSWKFKSGSTYYRYTLSTEIIGKDTDDQDIEASVLTFDDPIGTEGQYEKASTVIYITKCSTRFHAYTNAQYGIESIAIRNKCSNLPNDSYYDGENIRFHIYGYVEGLSKSKYVDSQCTPVTVIGINEDSVINCAEHPEYSTQNGTDIIICNQMEPYFVGEIINGVIYMISQPSTDLITSGSSKNVNLGIFKVTSNFDVEYPHSDSTRVKRRFFTSNYISDDNERTRLNKICNRLYISKHDMIFNLSTTVSGNKDSYLHSLTDEHIVNIDMYKNESRLIQLKRTDSETNGIVNQNTAEKLFGHEFYIVKLHREKDDYRFLNFSDGCYRIINPFNPLGYGMAPGATSKEINQEYVLSATGKWKPIIAAGTVALWFGSFSESNISGAIELTDNPGWLIMAGQLITYQQYPRLFDQLIKIFHVSASSGTCHLPNLLNKIVIGNATNNRHKTGTEYDIEFAKANSSLKHSHYLPKESIQYDKSFDHEAHMHWYSTDMYYQVSQAVLDGGQRGQDWTSKEFKLGTDEWTGRGGNWWNWPSDAYVLPGHRVNFKLPEEQVAVTASKIPLEKDSFTVMRGVYIIKT